MFTQNCVPIQIVNIFIYNLAPRHSEQKTDNI